MREFAREYDHCFLGNGTDGVLVGYTGAMVPERVNAPERCNWYKSDRYYPPERPATPVPHRHYRKEVTRVPRPDDTWFELAPLGRSWYDVLDDDGRASRVVSFRQRFDPLTAVLRSDVRFGDASARVTTLLHAQLPLLLVRCRFDREVRVRATLSPGPWAPGEEEPDPFTDLALEAGPVARVRFCLGALAGEQALWLDVPPERHDGAPRQLSLETRCRQVTLFHAVVDRRDRVDLGRVVEHARSLGFNGLLAEHAAVWRGYRRRSSVTLPDPDLQRLYDRGITLFRQIQSPESGGIPVGLLRQTWSSHLFWDAYFPTRALLEANQVEAARAQCGFLLRTAAGAREHARATFGVEGLAWDWELTHDGRRAYGEDWAHLAEQVHNGAAYSNLLFDTYRFTRDRALLAQIEPLLTGIAEFFRRAVVERRGGTASSAPTGTRPLVGVHESAVRVPDDAFNLAGAIRVFENAASASPGRGWRSIADGLRPALDALYDGRIFRPYAGAAETTLTLSSLAPIWPMELIAPRDPRARSTARTFLRHPSFLAAGGWPRSVWAAAILARIFADQGRGADANDLLRRCLRAMNVHGGVAELLGEDGRWNLQYFATAHGALCSAIHAMLLRHDDAALRPFPALPPSWRDVAFERLLIDGYEVSATRENGRLARLELTNRAHEPRTLLAPLGRNAHSVMLEPGESRVLRPR